MWQIVNWVLWRGSHHGVVSHITSSRQYILLEKWTKWVIYYKFEHRVDIAEGSIYCYINAVVMLVLCSSFFSLPFPTRQIPQSFSMASFQLSVLYFFFLTVLSSRVKNSTFLLQIHTAAYLFKICKTIFHALPSRSLKLFLRKSLLNIGENVFQNHTRVSICLGLYSLLLDSTFLSPKWIFPNILCLQPIF